MSRFASLPGAVAGDHGIAHYGEPLREQRALDRGTAFAELADRAVVALTGPERLTWLNSITSQAVDRLPAGASTELLVLDVQGRVEHAAGVYDDGETTYLLVDIDDAEPLSTWLLRMRFRAQVEIAATTDWVLVGFNAGGAAEAVVTAVLGDDARIWVDPWSVVTPGGWQYSHAAEHPGADRSWREAIVTPAQRDALIAQRGSVTAAGLLSVDALRIAAWRPRWANERDDRVIPHEVDWLRSAVHLNKGCYRGQETVAKVHNLGHPPRRLVMLHLDGSDSVIPAPGTTVYDGEDEVGVVTSAAMHHELGPIALAIVSRRVPVESSLSVRLDDVVISAAQEVIVPADVGATANVPRLTRLSRRPLKQD